MAEQFTPKEKKQWLEWLETCKRIRDGHEPASNETEREKSKRIKRLLDPANFYDFCRYYFPDYASAPFAWFHRVAIEDILVKKERNNIWEWPRESAKSVFADVLLVSYLLFTGWLDGLILASENEDKAKNLLKDVQAQLMNNRRIIADFGDFGISGSWMSGYFQTKDGIGFWAFGLGQNPAGVRNGHRRPNLGIVDDADNKDKAKNQKLTKERVDWIKGEFMGCLATLEHIFIYANNRVHKAGLTAHMVGDLEEGDPKHEGYKHIKVFFTEDPETKEMLLPEEGGVPSWTERFSLEDCLNKIEDMGYRNAMRQLYHKHIEDGNRFTDDNMPWVETLPLHMYDALVSYCDPAFGESGKGCYRCVALVGKKDLNYDVIWVWMRQTGSFAKAQYELSEMVKEGSPVIYTNNNKAGFRQVTCEHWVESNELQKILLKKIYEEENELRGTAWWPRFDMAKKADKIGRIESLEPLAEHGHLRFNIALRQDKHMQTLRDQFKGFPDGMIDGPDTVEGAISKLNKKVKRSTSKARAGKYKRNTARMG